MSDRDVAVIGPVETIMIGFPTSQLDGSVAPLLADLVEAGTIRIIDLVALRKDADGNVEALELSELDDDEASPFDQLDGEIGELFSEDDLRLAGEQLPADSAAVLVLWENSWAAKLAIGISHAGGQVLMHDRIPATTVRDAVLAAQVS